ncbi:MAG: hypothetical protein GY696_25540, partial [Gammaproteobacteria bacterium]|nr:hypothetical protein [Gammaproteobacteria bacterium]
DSPGSARSSGSLQPMQQSTITAADQTALVVRVSDSSRAVENTALTRGSDEPIDSQVVDTESADRRMDPQEGVNLEPSGEIASHVIQSVPQAETSRPYFFAVGRPRLPLGSDATNDSVSQKQPSTQEVWELMTVMGQQMAAFRKEKEEQDARIRKEKEEQDARIYDQQTELDNAQRMMQNTVDALYAKEQVAVNELRVVKKRLRNAQEELNRRLSMDPAGSNEDQVTLSQAESEPTNGLAHVQVDPAPVVSNPKRGGTTTFGLLPHDEHVSDESVVDESSDGEPESRESDDSHTTMKGGEDAKSLFITGLADQTIKDDKPEIELGDEELLEAARDTAME